MLLLITVDLLMLTMKNRCWLTTLIIFIFPLHQGIYARHLLGNASAPNAEQFGQCVEPLATVALQLGEGSVLNTSVLQDRNSSTPVSQRAAGHVTLDGRSERFSNLWQMFFFLFFFPPAPSLIQEKMDSFCTRPKVGRFSSRSRTSWGNMCFLLRRSVSGAQLLSVQTEFDWHSGSQDSEGITVMWWTLWWFMLLCDNPLKRCFLLIIRRLNSTTPNMLSLHRGGTHPGSWRTWRYVYCWPLTCELLLMEKKNTWKVHTHRAVKKSPIISI